MVTCDPEDRKRNNMKQSPVLVIEVLSPARKIMIGEENLLFTGSWLAYVSMC